MEQINTRGLVFDMLSAVFREGRQSHLVLSDTLTVYEYLDKRDRAFISRLFRGVLEQSVRLDMIIDRFSKTPVRKMKPTIRILLRMGSYQILFMDHVPDSAACDETVRLAKKRGFKNLSGFVNGVLRSISRNKEEMIMPDMEKDPAAYLAYTYSLPEWLAGKWLADYGFETACAMGEAALKKSTLTVRVRSQFLVSFPGEKKRAGMSDLVRELQSRGISMTSGQIWEDALGIEGFDKLENIPQFVDGTITVQDESTMLSARIADVKGTDIVIDMCAAPGGKTIHLADYMNASYRKIISRGTIVPQGRIYARDISQARADKISENVKRLRLRNVKVQVQDALELCEKDIGSADVVVCDVPCSGLGVLSRKPDIKLNMNPEKIDELAALQRDILKAAAQYIKEGGTLVYSTCTVTHEENIDNVRWALENLPLELSPIADYLPFKLRKESTKEGYLQILPGEFGSDGFFAAKFVKKSRQAGS